MASWLASSYGGLIFVTLSFLVASTKVQCRNSSFLSNSSQISMHWQPQPSNLSRAVRFVRSAVRGRRAPLNSVSVPFPSSFYCSATTINPLLVSSKLMVVVCKKFAPGLLQWFVPQQSWLREIAKSSKLFILCKCSPKIVITICHKSVDIGGQLGLLPHWHLKLTKS